MAGSTCTIGGVAFGSMASSQGRKCKSIHVDAAAYDKKRFHPPGADGNFIVRCGRTGGKLTAHVRYIDTLSNALTAFSSDRDAWRNTAVTIVDDKGDSFDNCNLSTMTRVSDPVGISRGGVSLVYFDATAVFDWDG